MGESDASEEAIDEALRHWRQGDVSRDTGLEFVHLADLSRPHSPYSIQAAASNDIDALGIAIVPIIKDSGMEHRRRDSRFCSFNWTKAFEIRLS